MTSKWAKSEPAIVPAFLTFAIATLQFVLDASPDDNVSNLNKFVTSWAVDPVCEIM